MLHRWVRFIVAWLPSWVRPPLDEWGAVVEVRLMSTPECADALLEGYTCLADQSIVTYTLPALSCKHIMVQSYCLRGHNPIARQVTILLLMRLLRGLPPIYDLHSCLKASENAGITTGQECWSACPDLKANIQQMLLTAGTCGDGRYPRTARPDLDTCKLQTRLTMNKCGGGRYPRTARCCARSWTPTAATSATRPR